MTTEEKFRAAVNVIRSLPKNGSYQPSNELMLRFYSYFKQATEGPCPDNRPPFWDLVAKAKYNAWKKLGDMSKNEAMTKYVDELHSIVETMSYSDKVANFLEAPTNELDGINFDDLELIAGDVLEKVRSQPNSPLASRESSPIRFISGLSSNVLAEESDHSDEEYTDTIEVPNQLEDLSHVVNIPNGEPPKMETAPKMVQHVSRTRTRSQNHTIDISQEVARTIECLKSDLQKLTDQVNLLETANKKALIKRRSLFGGLHPQIIAIMIVWPFVASFITNRWILKRK